ncbi:DNA/RNA non-specific endonuclease [Corallococcus sp. EGB]|uniref:DNA/RNA non-specific endonuclease n=1 Tax=Corallococcus sp. EGB TaxID=1521117 RepID=UPI001CBCBD08|nr:DNA/RNA non-specific endonuclease [Corallococcus sp. EGB]
MRQAAEAARLAAEAARKAAEAARKALEAAQKGVAAARQQQAAAQKAAADAQRAAAAQGQTPEGAKRTKAAADAAVAANTQAKDKLANAEKGLQAAEEKVALAAKKAEEAMGKANMAATQEKKTPPFTQKDLDSVKPKKNELVSAFEGTSRRGELEKLLGTVAPPSTQPVATSQPVDGEKLPAALDAVDPKDIEAALKLADGQTYTDPSSGAKYQVKKDATTGDTVLSDAKNGNTVTVKPDGSYTSTVTSQGKTKSGGTVDSTWTKSSDARGHATSLQSRKTSTEQHPETGATTTSATTTYDASRSPPVPQSRTEEMRMERPPAALAQKPGTPQGPTTVKTETQFDARGLPTKQTKTTEVRTQGYNAGAVNDFEASQGKALGDASKGADHHKANNPATSLKPGESSLTLTEETRYNAKGEPAVSTQKTDSVELKPAPKDANGNGVQVVRRQQEVTRGPKDATSTDSLPAVSSGTPGHMSSRTTATSYDPDGSTFEKGHASRTQTVSQASGTVDANGQVQLKHEPLEVKSLQEAGKNRWKYDHVSFEVDGNGKPVQGKEPKKLDKERQLPLLQDIKDWAVDGLKDLANAAGDLARDALSFAKEELLKPVDAAIDQMTGPVEDRLADEIKQLNSPGDALTLSGNLDAKVGLKGGIGGEIEVEMTSDGKYQLSAEVTGDVGVGVVGSASVSGGGRMEMTFDTPEEAARAAIILGKGPAAIASGGKDQKFMLDHLTAMEVSLGVEAEAGLEGKVGPFNADLSASIGATQSYRVEFEKGKPTHLVSTVEVEGSGAAILAAGFKGKVGVELGGEVSGTVSLETRIPLDASKVDATDVMSFIHNPVSAALVDSAETTISIEGSVDAGKEGQFFTAELSGLSGEELKGVAKKMMAGDFETAFDGVQYESKTTSGSYKDREVGVGAKLGVVDFEINARHRDMTAEGSGGEAGPKVSAGGDGEGGGKTKKNRGGGGTSGSSGSKGSDGNSPTGGSKPSGSAGGTDASSKPGGNATTGKGQQPGTMANAPTPEQVARPPANRLPPNAYRVNPATGQLILAPGSQQPRAERPATTEARPATPERATDNTGRPPVPVVRNPQLPGRTTRVRYDDGKVRIEAGPGATREDIQAHLETARILQRYEGAMGKVRQLIDKVKQAITGMPGYGSQGFESRLEVKKLSSILKDLEAMRAQLEQSIKGATNMLTTATAAQRAELERQISSVESQFRTHAAQVDSLVEGRGYVAREDEVAPVVDPDERLPRGVDAWVSEVLPPLIKPKDVKVHVAGMPPAPGPGAHWDGETLRVIDSGGMGEFVVNRERIGSLPEGVPPWVARAIPPHIQPGALRIEASKVTTGKPNDNLRSPEPNTAYWVDGRYLYVTDSRGRVASVEGDLYLVEKQVRSRDQSKANKLYFYTESGTRVPLMDGGAGGQPSKYPHDEGGHLIGAQFGGPAEFITYVPQTRYQNGSVTKLPWDPRLRKDANGDVIPPKDRDYILNWHELEMDSAKRLGGGDSIRVRILPQFISASTNRPDAIRVEAFVRTPEGEVGRNDWVFGNTSRMDRFEKDKPEGQGDEGGVAPRATAS